MKRKVFTKIDSHKEGLLQPAKPKPFFQQILNCGHADHEEFDAKSFPFDEQIPNWRGDVFDAHFMNAATGRKFTNKHHVKGEGAKKRSDFERFEFAFCLEWIDRTADGVTFRDRCYNEFTVKSNGCMDHPKAEFKDGPNRIFYFLIRGDVCNWGMLKDPLNPAADDSKVGWTYPQYRLHAEKLAREERKLAVEEDRDDQDTIFDDRMREFETWWRLEERKDKQQGGAKASTARGYSLMGQHTIPPPFMTVQTGDTVEVVGQEGNNVADDPVPGFSRITLNGSATLKPRGVVNYRQRIGKDTSEGRPDLDVKRLQMQQVKGKKSQAVKYPPPFVAVNQKEQKFTVSQKENFFSDVRKDRKPRRDETVGEGRN